MVKCHRNSKPTSRRHRPRFGAARAPHRGTLRGVDNPPANGENSIVGGTIAADVQQVYQPDARSPSRSEASAQRAGEGVPARLVATKRAQAMQNVSRGRAGAFRENLQALGCVRRRTLWNQLR